MLGPTRAAQETPKKNKCQNWGKAPRSAKPKNFIGGFVSQKFPPRGPALRLKNTRAPKI
jgi:hypothetical protein